MNLRPLFLPAMSGGVLLGTLVRPLLSPHTKRLVGYALGAAGALCLVIGTIVLAYAWKRRDLD